MMKLAIILILFAVKSILAVGPETQDERWEKCNEAQDNGLASLGNALNRTEFYSMEATDPCTTCKVWHLGTVKRTADVPYTEVKPGTIKHDMNVGFAALNILCDCQDKTGTKGQIFDVWTEPRGSVDFITNSNTGQVQFENAKVLSDMQTGNKIECRGTEKWKDSCGKLKQQMSFNPTIKLAVERLFPAESTNRINNEKALLDKLKCA